MRGFLLSFLYLLCANAWASPASKLSEMLESVYHSPTFEIWHEQREVLQTKGYEIWNAHQDDAEFCRELSKLSPKYLSEVTSWTTNDLSPCYSLIWLAAETHSSHLNALFNQTNIFSTSRQLEVCDTSKAERKTLGPSRKVTIDTTGKPLLVRGDLNRCEVAFTFDDGPHSKLTLELIESLRKENVTANFFVVGRNVDRHPRIVDFTAEQGHIVGNHSFSHKNLPKLSYSAGKEEIVRGFQSLLNMWDYVSPFFRYPYGAFTKKTRNFLAEQDVAEFFWNMDTLDWKIKDPRELLHHVYNEIDREKRGILLFHDVQPQTIEVIPHVLIALKKAGYSTAVFLPEELIEDEFPN